MTAQEYNWRMVCHECGMKWPANQARAVSALRCCMSKNTSKIKVHNLDRACERCFDAEYPVYVKTAEDRKADARRANEAAYAIAAALRDG